MAFAAGTDALSRRVSGLLSATTLKNKRNATMSGMRSGVTAPSIVPAGITISGAFWAGRLVDKVAATTAAAHHGT
jgi:hypothetical protein